MLRDPREEELDRLRHNAIVPPRDKCPYCGHDISPEGDGDKVSITRKQIKVLQYIANYILGNRRGPTTREVAEAMGSKNVHLGSQYLHALEHKGLITRVPRRQRSISITQRGYQAIQQLGPALMDDVE